MLREAVLRAVDLFADDAGHALLKDVVAYVQETLGDHERFPNGRMTNYTRYTKTDLEARGELARVPKKTPQRIQRLA